MRFSSGPLWLLPALLLTACVGAGRGATSGPDNLSPEERRMQALETRQVQLQRRLDAQNPARYDEDNMRLREELRTLRGDTEKMRHDLQMLDKRSKDLYQELDGRLQALESRPAGAAAATAAPAAPAINATVPAVPGAPVTAAVVASTPAPAAGAAITQGAGTPEEEAAYLAAFDLLKNGKYDDAIQGFQGVLKQWPSGRYADNAAYWMGEASYVKKDFAGAQTAFQTVVTSYPTSPKSADAMLKLGLTQAELKQMEPARQTLADVVKKYPGSNAAKLAQQKLQALSAPETPAPAAKPAVPKKR